MLEIKNMNKLNYGNKKINCLVKGKVRNWRNKNKLNNNYKNIWNNKWVKRLKIKKDIEEWIMKNCFIINPIWKICRVFTS